MKKIVVLIVVACLAFVASASATSSSSCKLRKITYQVKSVFGTNYMFLQADAWCQSGFDPIYKWEVAAPAPLTAWHARQYDRATKQMRFQVFYTRNSAGRKVLAGAGVTFMVGRNQDDYLSCTINADGLRGVVRAKDCLLPH